MPRKYSALTRALQLETGVLNNAGLAGLKAPAPSVAAGAAAANGLGATLLATLQLCVTRPTHEVQDRTCCKARHPGCAGAYLDGRLARGAQALHFPCRLRMYECEGEETLADGTLQEEDSFSSLLRLPGCLRFFGSFCFFYYRISDSELRQSYYRMASITR